MKGDLSEAEIAAVPEQVYKGYSVTPKPKVTLNGARLKEGRDFVYTYSENDGYGVGTVSIEPVSGSSEYVLKGEAPRAIFVVR